MTLATSTLYHDTTGCLEVVGLIDFVRNYRPLKATTPLSRAHKFRGITIRKLKHEKYANMRAKMCRNKHFERLIPVTIYSEHFRWQCSLNLKKTTLLSIPNILLPSIPNIFTYSIRAISFDNFLFLLKPSEEFILRSLKDLEVCAVLSDSTAIKQMPTCFTYSITNEYRLSQDKLFPRPKQKRIDES
ncbi:hypothetical protein WN51_05902 [Melipona quadrifasciata]|uniref:Uncharacterized protein n=1 Tax=Melipona quadrifasciata TaxID=166423 RepID=A0A0N0BIV8_9HYME|nr:hypothetical protein WN51_05902 [Melipona quadrifasciata]